MLHSATSWLPPRGTEASVDTVLKARDASRRGATGTTNNGEDSAGTNANGGDGTAGAVGASEQAIAIAQLMPTVGQLTQRLDAMENAAERTQQPAVTDPAPSAAPIRTAEARIPWRSPSPDVSSEPSDDDYSSESSSSSGDHVRRGRSHRHRRSRRSSDQRRSRHHRRNEKNAKELDWQPFKPTASGVRVETWIAKVDLAVEGARISNRGDWTDEELYYVVGNKLQDDAAKSWVQINMELARHDCTWRKLKEALLRRYGERPDLAQAEWRVMQRTVQPGKTFADFASGIHYAAGQKPVREETLLGQFYRELEKTTRQLVKLAPAPSALGEAEDKASRIDDSSYNAARGMRNTG
ncbi:unnamed protein product [Phytophthora fragariaefolia]|uniref:Unnamed protein product n=1 Tax=Phytophthora fragariaefolia TaxID=1490495 RepID=A0A9W6YFV9_9STRA|nr:unnamed protein product [Phytophthora fragariaefolia]